MAEQNEQVEEIKDPQGLLKAYNQAKEDLVALRSEKKELETQLEQADQSAVEKWKTRAIKAEAKANLETQGIKNADRILKYVNLEGVDFDDNDALTGFDDKVTALKGDFPELFDAKTRAGRSSADIHANSPVERKLSGTEAQVARLFARA